MIEGGSDSANHGVQYAPWLPEEGLIVGLNKEDETTTHIGTKQYVHTQSKDKLRAVSSYNRA